MSVALTSRRRFIQSGTVLLLGGILQACGGAAAPLAGASTASVAAASAASLSAAKPAPASAAASPAPSSPKPAASGLEKVTVALPALSQSQNPMLIARSKGYYREEGIDIDLPVVVPNLSVQGLLGGTYPFSSAVSQVAVARLGGAALKVVFNPTNNITWWLMASAKSGVKTVEGLKGKSLAIESPGSLSDTFMRVILRKHGLNPDTDVNFVGLGAPANWIKAVIDGSVDAGFASDADSYLLGSQQGLTELAWAGAELHAFTSGMGTSDKLLAEKPDLVRRFLRASTKGLRLYRASKTQAVSILADALKRPAEDLSKAYDLEVKVTQDNPMLNDADQQEFLQLVGASLNNKQSVAPGQVFDYSITRQAIQDLADQHWMPS